MIVFKSYFKIIKSYLPVIVIFTAVFLGFAVFASSTNQSNSINFETTKPKIAIINHDQETELIKTFRTFIEKNAEIIKIGEGKEEISDALFYRSIDFVVIIPENFTADFLVKKDPVITTKQVPDSYYASYTKRLLNRFLNTAKLYLDNDTKEENAYRLTLKDLEKGATVHIQTNQDQNKASQVNYYYNFANYVMLAILIFVTSMTLFSFHEPTKKKKNLLAPLPYRKINHQLLLGNLLLTGALWLLYVLLSIILYGSYMFTFAGLLYMLNALCFALAALGIGFLVGTLIKNSELANLIANVFSLGSSFICGAFVPQELLNKTVLTIGKIFPSYWYITNNNLIAALHEISSKTLSPIVINMSITLLFAIVFYVITNFISKKKTIS